MGDLDYSKTREREKLWSYVNSLVNFRKGEYLDTGFVKKREKQTYVLASKRLTHVENVVDNVDNFL